MLVYYYRWVDTMKYRCSLGKKESVLNGNYIATRYEKRRTHVRHAKTEFVIIR